MGRIKDMMDRIEERKEKRHEYEQGYATKQDIKRLKRDLSDNTVKESNKKEIREAGKKVIGAFAHGFGNIAQSLNNSSDKRRMRIAQMPAKMSDMDIIRQPKLGLLKSPQMRYRDIRGRLQKRRGR